MLAGLLIALAGLPTGAARAQSASALTADQKAEMKQHYERGQRAYDIGKYADAIDEYAKVYEISGNPAMLFNIAQAHRLNNQVPEAVRFYRRYLQRAPNAPNRADVEQKIAELEKLPDNRSPAPALTPAPPAPPLPSAAAPAPAPPAPAPPPPPPPPAPVVTAPPAPPPAATTPIEPVPVGPPGAPIEPVPAASGGGNGRIWGVVALLGVGAGGLVLASFEGLAASSKADTIAAQSRGGKVFDPSVETAGRRENAIAITAAIVGGAALITGGVLLLTGSHAAAAEAAPRPGVSFVPWIVPTSTGLVGAGASWSY